MRDDTMHTLVASSNRGRYALDDPDHHLTTGQPLAMLLGGSWTPGRVEHSTSPDAEGCYVLTGMAQVRIGYYFIAQDGSVCGLCTGMQVRVS